MKKTKVFLNTAEWQLVIDGLNKLRTNLIETGNYTNCVDETLLKVITAPVKAVKVS